MSTIPTSEFADTLQTLSHDEFVSFVADLWETSGWDTQTEEMTIVVEKGNRRERLLVVPALVLARFRSVPPVDGTVNRIVTPLRIGGPGDLPRGTPDAPVVDAEDLRHRLLYGIDTEAGEQLCTDHLGVSLRGPEWADEPTRTEYIVGEMAKRLPDRQSDGPAPVSRRTTLSLLGFGAVGGVVYGAREFLQRGNSGPSSFDDNPPPTPEDVGAPDARFDFQFENGTVTILHTGGESIFAGNLYVRGDGLVDGTEIRWSEAQEYTIESEIQRGDTLEISYDVDGAIDVVWDDDSKKATLASYTGPETEPEQVSSLRPPSVDFRYSFGNGILTITHANGDTVAAGRLLIRGTDFDDAPSYRWSESPSTFDSTKIAAGSSITLSVDKTVSLQIYWDHEAIDEPVRLDQYTGPGRPLDADIGGPSTFNYDNANTGVAANTTGPTGAVTERFLFETDRPVGSSPTVVDGRLHIANLAGNVYALDAADGTEIWRFETSDVIWSGSATVADNVVYIGSTDGNLYALNAETGAVRWEFPRLRRVLSSPTLAEVDGHPMLFVTGEGPGPRGMLFGVDAATGTERWRFELGGEPSSAPAVVDGTVFVGGNEGTAYALDATDETELWAVQEPEERRVANGGVHEMDMPPAVHDGTVYIGSTSGYLYALDTESGESRWEFETGGGIGSSPAVVESVPTDDGGFGRTVYVGSADDSVYAIDATDGSERWSYETNGLVLSSPTVVGTAVSAAVATVYVGSFGSRFYALDATDGTERWSYGTGGQILSSPAIADGTVYFGSGDGIVYALEENAE
jgi:outer membrane protein assembly factor BamB